MLSGPSTLFKYKTPPMRRRSYGLPVIIPCEDCASILVLITNPRNGRRVRIHLDTLAAHPALVYSYDKHGPPHYHAESAGKRRSLS